MVVLKYTVSACVVMSGAPLWCPYQNEMMCNIQHFWAMYITSII